MEDPLYIEYFSNLLKIMSTGGQESDYSASVKMQIKTEGHEP
jgi:hypothetical protein